MLDIKAVIFAKHKGVKFDEDHSEANFAKHDKTELRYSKLRQTEQKKRVGRTLLRIAAAVFSLLLCIAPHPIGVYGEGAEAEKGESAVSGERMLVPSGEPFGVRIHTDGVTVFRVEEGSPAQRCGVMQGDLIKKINGEPVLGVLDFSKRAAELLKEGSTLKKGVELEVWRGKEQVRLSLTPQMLTEAAKDYKRQGSLGVYLRDTLAGIGTMTYFDPQSGSFAGLGHGICEGKSGMLLPITGGSITDVRITSICKGCPGLPGQLRGIFCPGVKGSVLKNAEEGIFGVFQKTMPYRGTPLPVASTTQVKEGRAEILCTLSGSAPKRYEIEIERIYHFEKEGKNFLLHVTDPTLLEQTGGIVQGMSGSPILQDGRIVGAVTHVLVDDPQRGYGIFIGNMIKAAE